MLTANGSDTNAKSSAATLNSSASSLLASQSSASDPSAYRHPILYDKQTGSTNKQLDDVLGTLVEPDRSSQITNTNDFPLDHYQLLQLRQQQQQHPLGEFFSGLSPHRSHFMNQPHVHPTPPSMSSHQLPLPAPPMMLPNGMPASMTTPIPRIISNLSPSRSSAPSDLLPPLSPSDSLGSASSIALDPSNGSATNRNQLQQHYTPPIFAHNYNDNGQHDLNPTYSDDFSAQPRQPQQPINLLADPTQQQRHKQQMLDTQFLFNNRPLPRPPATELHQNSTILGSRPQYPDPAGLQRLTQAPSRHMPPSPPYAHVSGLDGDEASINNRNRFGMPQDRNSPVNNGAPLGSSTIASLGAKQEPTFTSTTQGAGLPSCAAIQNSTSSAICYEDQEYPMKDIMRALEVYTAEDSRSIEQLLPQSLLWLHLGQQQQLSRQTQTPPIPRPLLTLDPLQQTIGGSQMKDLFPSANFVAMCRSSVFMAQPRRAKNILGQWKIIVNLPGHKYRGVAVSQMVRVEECTRPMSECAAMSLSGPSTQSTTTTTPTIFNKSRCLQLYENQRLLVWSQQQGLHLDIFRIPVSCSCHMSRNRL